MPRTALPFPVHYDPDKVGEVWKVPYEERAEEARKWARQNDLSPAADDRFKICLEAAALSVLDLPQFQG